MNKKTLFLILLAGILVAPAVVSADVPNMISNIQSAFVTVGGSIVVIGWIIAGILYLTAAGSPEKTKLAKGALFAAVIGTALIVLAAGAKDLINQLLNAAGPQNRP